MATASLLICAGDGGTFKECTQCRDIKPTTEFSPLATVVSGLRSSCKECCRRSALAYHYDNRDSILERNRARYREDPALHRERALAWHYANHEESKRRAKSWKRRNGARVSDYNRQYYNDNKSELIAKSAEWARLNASSRRDYMRGWYDANPGKHSEYGKRRRESLRFRIENAIRCRIWSGITKGSKRGRRTLELLDYDIGALKEHLEKQFQPGMTWDNYGEWHIDHIRPLSSFGYETPDDPEFKQAWALSNLQPLWARDNLSKGAKWALSLYGADEAA